MLTALTQQVRAFYCGDTDSVTYGKSFRFIIILQLQMMPLGECVRAARANALGRPGRMR